MSGIIYLLAPVCIGIYLIHVLVAYLIRIQAFHKLKRRLFQFMGAYPPPTNRSSARDADDDSQRHLSRILEEGRLRMRPLRAPRGPANPQGVGDEQKELRRMHILLNVVHKKALRKDKGELTLPHESALSAREEAHSSIVLESSTDDDLRDDLSLNSVKTSGTNRSTGTTKAYSRKACTICLEEYKHKDDICWSKNENCIHAYHLDCMTAWLMEHDECPQCRDKYVEEEFDTTQQCAQLGFHFMPADD